MRLSVFVLIFVCVYSTLTSASDYKWLEWSEREIGLLSSIVLQALPDSVPLNPSNPFANHPSAIELGKRLFFDTKLSANQQASCASCHQPHLNFTDGLEKSVGLAEMTRNAPTLLGIAHNTWFFVDGRRDSLWAQALSPLESAPEMGSTRSEVVKYVLSDESYLKLYTDVFGFPDIDRDKIPRRAGPFSDRLGKKTWKNLRANVKFKINVTFANIGRAIASYERSIQPKYGKLEMFYDQLKGDDLTRQPILDAQQQAGLKLFLDVGKTQCMNCHNGPLMSNGGFHNIGTGSREGSQLDFGRVIGIEAVFQDEFNCFGNYSGVPPNECVALRFVNRRDNHSPLLGAYKVPTLRGLGKTAPYGHDGRFQNLEAIVRHYQEPPKESFRHELIPLEVSEQEIEDLVRFLKVL